MLNRMLIETVKEHSEKTALVYDKFRLNFKELYINVVGLSKGLSSIGVNQSDCIALVLPNCPEFVISFYAAAKLNAVVLPLNPMFKGDEIKYYISDSGASVIITDITRADMCRNIIEQLDRKIDLIVVNGVKASSICFNDLIKKETDDDEQAPYEGDVLYQYSSGSTGRPKRVCRTQKNLLAQARNCTSTLNITSSDNILCIVPLFHAYGFGDCLLAATYTGASIIILEQSVQDGTPIEMPFLFRRPRVLELIEKEKITVLPGVPYLFSILAGTSYETRSDLATLKLCISAGNFLSTDIFDKFLQRFGIPIRQLYGCTEAGSVAINLDKAPEIKYDSVGLPMKNVEIKIMDDEGNELPCGLSGEIVIKSETLASGYYNMPELNKEVFKDGHFFTGDLGKKDEKGRIQITGRKKIFIDTGGYKVDPLEIEDILITHPKVSEAVVVGTKGPLEGEIIKAVIVLQEKCEQREILSYCRDKLAPFKVPKIIEFRYEIPKSPLGKILRKNLI